MPSDVAIQELLYAILKQKCLKDIDWNQVAADPILTQTITNGHAARMRYARFKKQMETARANIPPTAEPPLPSPRRGRNTASKRSRVEKNESPKKNKRGSNAAPSSAALMKAENHHALSSFTSQATSSSFQSQSQQSEESLHTSDREGTADSTADIHPGMKTTQAELSRIKRERLSHTQQTVASSSTVISAPHLLSNANGTTTHAPMLAGQYAHTPLTPITTPRYCMERSASPSPSLRHDQGQRQGQGRGQMDSFVTDEYTASFEGGGRSFPPLFGEASFGIDMNMGSMGLNMGLGELGMGIGMGGEIGPFDQVWGDGDGGGGSGSGSDGRVAVKVEPRWEEAYRH